MSSRAGYPYGTMWSWCSWPGWSSHNSRGQPSCTISMWDRSSSSEGRTALLKTSRLLLALLVMGGPGTRPSSSSPPRRWVYRSIDLSVYHSIDMIRLVENATHWWDITLLSAFGQVEQWSKRWPEGSPPNHLFFFRGFTVVSPMFGSSSSLLVRMPLENLMYSL